jgi:hypoxanthine phosphoribosyltransferase
MQRQPSTPVPPAVLRARHQAELLVAPEEVQRAIDRVSVLLSLRLQDANPLVLVVMHGALPYAGELLRRFAFPLELGYLHVGRYGTATRGGALRWHAEPVQDLVARTVLVVDDVLDRGDTLAAIRTWALEAGAAAVLTTVLVDKAVAADRPIGADHAALQCPDRYLFGCGMDFRGYWRNLPGIYALPESMVDP